MHLPLSILIVDLFLRLYFCLRIIQRRLNVGVTWAWVFLILFLPILGSVLYFYFGEYRLGRRRRARMAATAIAVEIQMQQLSAKTAQAAQDGESARSFTSAVRSLFNAPLLSGNDVELLKNAAEAFPQMIADIDRAKTTCDMEFYIWSDGGKADEFGEALIRAAKRGVQCRVLVDQIGSAAFLKGAMVQKLIAGGVHLHAALPSGFIRSFFGRPDLRIHRKILVVDGAIGYTGSLNLADPVYFKRDAGVGQWVDALCRVRGPAVEALGLVFLSDWGVETHTALPLLTQKSLFQTPAQPRNALVQCLASGPAMNHSAIEETLIMAIYAARKTLVLTTPYFVPSEAMLYALMTTARRGVAVTLIVPAKVDSKLTQYASRSFARDLLEAGVRVALYKEGMLHTKSVAIDGELALFGSLNLDPRSLRINFEISLVIYDAVFLQALSELQREYIAHSEILDLAACNARSWVTVLKEDLARLAGPLL